ncbi:MAG: HdeD family acid-resistance protein [Thermoguttaceae bacterium]
MATAGYRPQLGSIAALEHLHRTWGWFVGLGVVLMILGVIAIGSAIATTLVSILLFGWLLIIGGVLEAGYAFWQERWGAFFIDLMVGILYAVVGFMMVANPGIAALSLTLLVAMFLILAGLFRSVAALAARPPHWGWLLFHGVISLILGVLIWQQWPVSGLWVIGLFVGIELLLNGATLVALGTSARSLPLPGEP